MRLGFVELMTDLPSMDKDMIYEDSFMEHIFLISSTNPWYGNSIFYIHTLKVPPHILRVFSYNIMHGIMILSKMVSWIYSKYDYT